MDRIDLHTHSTFSDGTMTPEELVAQAAKAGLKAFALTDHDTADGIPRALKAGREQGIEVVPGIEFSTEYQGQDIHIVGLEPDYTASGFHEQVRLYRKNRLDRNRKIICKMQQDGLDISFEKMQARFGDTVWTRAHFARYLTEHGYTPDIDTAFRTKLNYGCPYFVPRVKIHPAQVVALLRQYHGIPVLAHPFQYKFSSLELFTLLRLLKENGLIGMEVYYSTHTPQQESLLLEACQTLSLLPSGGSDFHGKNKPLIHIGSGRGNLSIPYEILTQLRTGRDSRYPLELSAQSNPSHQAGED